MRTDRQTDRLNEANSRFTRFCERAKKWEQPITTSWWATDEYDAELHLLSKFGPVSPNKISECFTGDLSSTFLVKHAL
jgi:hypothetical protein